MGFHHFYSVLWRQLCHLCREKGQKITERTTNLSCLSKGLLCAGADAQQRLQNGQTQEHVVLHGILTPFGNLLQARVGPAKSQNDIDRKNGESCDRHTKNDQRNSQSPTNDEILRKVSDRRGKKLSRIGIVISRPAKQSHDVGRIRNIWIETLGKHSQ